MNIKVCDICDQRKNDEELSKITIVDFKGWDGDLMCPCRVKRKRRVDVCDDCINIIKRLSLDKQKEK